MNTHNNSHLFETEAAQLFHDSYVVTKLVTRCVCGATFTHSELYELWLHPVKTANSGFKQLRSTAEFKSDFEIEAVTLQPRQIPVCASCYPLRRRKPASQFPALSWAEWARTVQRKAQQSQEAARRPATPATPTEPGLDTL